jgi:GNAT superfamily N-acetyltransferase
MNRLLTRQITTYANQRGIKIVKYNPLVHDDLFGNSFVEAWCKGYVSNEKVNEILDVYRVRKGLDPVLQNDAIVKRTGLEIYLATVINKKKIKLIGIIAWSKYLPDDYLFGNLEYLKSKALRLSNSNFTISFNGLTKSEFKALETSQLEDLLLTDEDNPKFSGISKEEEKDLGDLLILCVDSRAKTKGVGTLLFSYFLKRAAKKYSNLLVYLGQKNGSVNSKMKDLAEKYGFRTTNAYFSRGSLGIRNRIFEGSEGEKMQFLTKHTEDELDFGVFQRNLDLTLEDLGTYTCSRNPPENFSFASNGSKYVGENDWDRFCGGNKGYTNPYAGNYSGSK